MKKKYFLLFFCLLIFPYRTTKAGTSDCPTEAYSKILLYLGEKPTSFLGESVNHLMKCLGPGSIVGGVVFVPPLQSISYLPPFNRGYNSDFVLKYIPTYLSSQSAQTRCSAAELLSFYKWDKAFAYLTPCFEEDPLEKAVIYGVLGDKQALPWLMAQYNDETRWKTRDDLIKAKKIYLMGFYQLGDEKMLGFLETIINNSEFPELKKWALAVKRKINPPLMP